ncbi:MAG: tetratricopeptide repeat protein, partial [Myxococcota bacterium]
VDSWFRLGQSYSALGQFDQAEKAMLRATEIQSDSAPIWAALGVVYWKNLQSVALKKSLDWRIPKFSSKLTSGSQGDVFRRDLALAKQAFQRSLKYQSNPRVHLFLGHLLLFQRQFQDAEKHYLSARKQAGFAVRAGLALGLLWIHQYRYREASQVLQKVVSMLPESKRTEATPSQVQIMASALYSLGMAHEGMGAIEKSIVAYQRYASQVPKTRFYAEGFCRLGRLYQIQKKYANALRVFRVCAALLPKDPSLRAVIKRLSRR